MSRNCLECGTPKLPKINTCLACEQKTFDYYGVAREPLCGSCENFFDGFCHLFDLDRFGAKVAEKIQRRLTLHSHSCEEYDRVREAVEPVSPHPLLWVDREEIRLFLEGPSAFWLDPQRWDGIDPVKDKFWMKRKESSMPVVAGLAVGAVAVAALLSRSRATT